MTSGQFRTLAMFLPLPIPFCPHLRNLWGKFPTSFIMEVSFFPFSYFRWVGEEHQRSKLLRGVAKCNLQGKSKFLQQHTNTNTGSKLLRGVTKCNLWRTNKQTKLHPWKSVFDDILLYGWDMIRPPSVPFQSHSQAVLARHNAKCMCTTYIHIYIYSVHINIHV